MYTESFTIQLLREFLSERTLASISVDFDLPVDLLENRLRGATAAILCQAFEYRVPFPANRPQSSFEVEAERLWDCRRQRSLSGAPSPQEHTSSESDGSKASGQQATSSLKCEDTYTSLEAYQQEALDAALRAGDIEGARLHMQILMEAGTCDLNENDD